MNLREKKFIQTVWNHYAQAGRRTLPWRKTRDPYKILVSEIMLQQTQVDRVIPKYHAFLKQFPTVRALEAAPLGDVLRAWQGLGYNRRAKMLHACAKAVVKTHGGTFPKDPKVLQTLPGIGPYTSGAVAAFAFNQAHPIIETNIRSGYLHHFFNDRTDVLDAEIMEVLERTLEEKNVREWYYALMDYGSYIKKTHGNPNSRSKHYAKQSAFKGSDREIRGALLRLLAERGETRTALHSKLTFEDIRVDAQLEKLMGEGMIISKRGRYYLP